MLFLFPLLLQAVPAGSKAGLQSPPVTVQLSENNWHHKCGSVYGLLLPRRAWYRPKYLCHEGKVHITVWLCVSCVSLCRMLCNNCFQDLLCCFMLQRKFTTLAEVIDILRHFLLKICYYSVCIHVSVPVCLSSICVCLCLCVYRYVPCRAVPCVYLSWRDRTVSSAKRGSVNCCVCWTSRGPWCRHFSNMSTSTGRYIMVYQKNLYNSVWYFYLGVILVEQIELSKCEDKNENELFINCLSTIVLSIVRCICPPNVFLSLVIQVHYTFTMSAVIWWLCSAARRYCSLLPLFTSATHS